jgi:hypothetical protein
MKKSAILAAVASLVFASAANAGTIKVEGENQLNNDKRTSAKVEIWEAAGPIGLGLEFRQYLAETGKPAYGNVVGKIGYALPTMYGVTPVLKAEAGVQTQATDNAFYGVIAELHKPVGPFKAELAYRYRSNISSNFVAEKRGSVGVAYDLNKKTEVGVTYHNYFKDTVKDTNAIAISMTRKF